jgi:hypothetical protein
LRLEGLEDRLAPATVSDAGGTTLLITLDNTGEKLTVVSQGSSYRFTSTASFADGGVSNPADFSGFGGTTLDLLSSGLARYDTVAVADSAAGTAVTFGDSGSNAYTDDFTVTLDDGSAGVTFSGSSTFDTTFGLSVSTDRGIALGSGAALKAADGDVTLLANQQATPTAGTFIGIDVVGAGITTTGAGDVTLQGRGGDSAGSANLFGVSLRAGATVEATGTGSVSITGTAGSGGSDNVGLVVTGTGTAVSAAAGGVSLAGTGQGTGDRNYGVEVVNGAAVQAAGSQDVSLSGTGGGSGTGTSN